MASVKPEMDTDGKCGDNFDREKIVRQELPNLKPVETWTNTLRETVARVPSAKQEAAKSLA